MPRNTKRLLTNRSTNEVALDGTDTQSNHETNDALHSNCSENKVTSSSANASEDNHAIRRQARTKRDKHSVTASRLTNASSETSIIKLPSKVNKRIKRGTTTHPSPQISTDAATNENSARPITSSSLAPIQYYLMKSEPHVFSIQDLQNCQDQQSEWDGVRNYVARNHLRQMNVNDQCWFYHSSCSIPAIVGKVHISRVAQPDPTAYNPEHSNYDPKSGTTPESCRWSSVQVQLDDIYENPISLHELRVQATTNPVVAKMTLLNQSRLSVIPITPEEWSVVNDLRLRKEKGEDLLQTD
jgi:predicted RNA-binding protein with PUA-like domain